MEINEFELSAADGILLLNDIRIEDRFFPQGHKLNREDISFLKSYGIKKITGVRACNSDIKSALALGMIAPQICGENLGYVVSKTTNTCKIVASVDGVFICSEQRLAKFNHIAPYLILNTIAPYKTVKKNDIIGSIKLCCPIVEQTFLDDIVFRLSGNEPLLKIESSSNIKASLIFTQFSQDKIEQKHASASIAHLQKIFPEFNFKFEQKLYCLHQQNDLAVCISEAAKKSPFVFIVPALPSSCPTDTLPTALSITSNNILCRGIPQDTLSDLMIATKKETKIIALPYHYDKNTSAIANQTIKIALSQPNLKIDDFLYLNTIPLNIQHLSIDEQKDLLSPPNNRGKNKEAPIAVIILAAGCSIRAKRNKLLVKIKGEPLFMRSIRAAIRSKASPVYVITGYHAEEIEEYLKDLDINILRNNDYASGIKTSIRLGLNSVPSFCKGALLIPADMPYISAKYINKMIRSFSLEKDKQVCISTYKSQKYNPILWSRSLYSKADLVPENANLREIFLEHRDYTTLVESDENCCVDVNFPYDIEVLTNK
ncbi:MAG: NTP transferase domain-containing protein [Alphaproteobacteria bacterium]|nr:NTP transferase domain-containing protein [Alphaproteobacteria bacterium]